MNGIMNENQLTIVKKHDIIKPLIHKIFSIFDNCYRDCHNKYLHTFEYRCVYNNNFTNNAHNEIHNLPLSDKSLGLYEFKNF